MTLQTTYVGLKLFPLLISMLFFLVAAEAIVRSPRLQNGQTGVTVIDAISMTSSAPSAPGMLAQFSPDGKKFTLILKRGNLARNVTEYQLLECRTHAAPAAKACNRSLVMRSSSDRPAIQAVTWLNDNETILFLGEREGGLQQVFSFNTHSGSLKQITTEARNLLSYSTTPDGRTLAFVESDCREMQASDPQHDAVVVSKEWFSDLMTGRKADELVYRANPELFVRSESGRARRIPTAERIPSFGSIPFLSPDGRYVAIQLQVTPANVPKIWAKYDNQDVQSAAVGKLPDELYSSVRRYWLIDLKNQASRILVDSPAVSERVAWSPEGQAVVISGVYLPLETPSEPERGLRSNLFSIEVRIPDRTLKVVADGDAGIFRWQSRGGGALIGSVDDCAGRREVLFVRKNSGWVEAENEKVMLPEVLLAQDLNTPPKILVRDRGSRTDRLLIDLNPQFANLSFGRVEEINFLASDGHSVRAGLYIPPDFVPGRVYPLVIQTHGWDANQFWIDGPFPTAFAAQPLAAKDFVVVQLPEDLSKMRTPEEIQAEVTSYEGAIDFLASRGIIDRNRVGIVGFSRTGWGVKYALTHSKYHFAAAVLENVSDGGYFSYLTLLNSISVWAPDYEGINGGLFWGGGQASWLRESPGFNLERVTTPVRLQADAPDELLGVWEWFAGLMRLHKAVELVYLRHGSHILARPQDRLRSLEGTVEWLDFWLNGYEDPKPEKADQYRRWRAMMQPNANHTTARDGTNDRHDPYPAPWMPGGR